MTEKRFTMKQFESTNWIYDNDKLIHTKEIMELLNNLHEENQLLIEDTEKHRKLAIQFDNRNKELVSENALLEKENEQLKQQINTMINELQTEKETAISRNERIRLDFAITVLEELR